MKDFEDRLMVGDVPKVIASAVGRESVESSPEARSFKRPKIGSDKDEVKVEVDDEPEQGSSQSMGTTTAYTQSVRDEANLRIITKDPSSVRTSDQSSSSQAKATKYYSRDDDRYSKTYSKAMSAAGPTLRSQAAVEPIKSYPSMHPKAREHYMERDARDAGIDQAAISQAKADKAKADKEKSAREQKSVEAPWTNSKGPPNNGAIVTPEQRRDGLKMWKDLLIRTNDYRPHQQRSDEENLKEVKILRTAMSDFRNLRLCGMAGLQDKHSDFAGLQAKYNIPGEFCMPEDLFREEQLDYNVIYYKRCCSVYDFYNLLSKDNPCYVERKLRRLNNVNEQHKSERRELPAAQEKVDRQGRNMAFSDSHGCET
jgi:hypothetical protein